MSAPMAIAVAASLSSWSAVACALPPLSSMSTRTGEFRGPMGDWIARYCTQTYLRRIRFDRPRDDLSINPILQFFGIRV